MVAGFLVLGETVTLSLLSFSSPLFFFFVFLVFLCGVPAVGDG
jgi:hypothetical protein